MARIAATALATLLAVSACGTPRPQAMPAVFSPTVLGKPGTPGAYVHVEAARSDGSPAAGVQVPELVVPWDDDDPLAAPPGDRIGKEPSFYSQMHPAGTVVQRTESDAKGAASLAFPVGPKARAYAYTADAAGAGEAIVASLIARPENIWGYEVRLVPAVPVRGDVTDADGRPAAGATVRASFRCGADPGLVVLMTTCNADGAFALPPIPAGAGDTGNAVSLRADAKDGTSVRRETTTAELRDAPLRLVLGR